MSKAFDVSAAGTAPRPVIAYPAGETVEWYGFTRHNFELEGHNAFIVEPPNPAPGLPWTWTIQWAEAFVPRTPVLKLLERGFHHVFIDVFATRMNAEGLRVTEDFYRLLRGLGLHPKMALVGMSYGGLFSLRWAAEHPETVGAIYLDAPVCDLGFCETKIRPDTPAKDAEEAHQTSDLIAGLYGTTREKLSEHPLSPINNFQAIAAAKIPIHCIRSGQDQSVNPLKNIDIFAERLQSAGGVIEVESRPYWGHHPHGLDDPQPLADFILKHYPGF